MRLAAGLTRLSLCAGLALCACSDQQTAETQTIVEVDAEPAVKRAAGAGELRVLVYGGDDLDALAATKSANAALDQHMSPPRFPMRVAVQPRGADGGRVFLLRATLTKLDGAFVAEAKLVTGYVRGTTRYARIVLEASCIGIEGCSALQTCEAGSCGDASFDAEELGRDVKRPTRVRMKTVPSAGADASIDSGIDAAEDAAPVDAAKAEYDSGAKTRDSDQPESGGAAPAHNAAMPRTAMPSKAEPARSCDDDDGGCDLAGCALTPDNAGCPEVDECAGSNVCTADFPCHDLPNGQYYACEGQFPGWSPLGSAGPYTLGADTVSDSITKLTWVKNAGTDMLKWMDARRFCADLQRGGYDDWRLPSKSELESLVKDTAQHPAIDREAFADTPPEGGYWSATPNAENPDFAWMVSFSIGYSSADQITQPYYTRCVR